MLHSLAHNAAGSAAPSSDAAVAAEVATQLFVQDVKQTIRWHAMVAGVALAATPLVYQLSRVVAHRHRADLVNIAKDAVQREELFNGEEADGILIDPSEEGGITISYNTLSGPHAKPPTGPLSRHHSRTNSISSNNNSSGQMALAATAAAAAAPDREKNHEAETATPHSARSAASSQPASSSSSLSLRVGRCHSWAVSSFARQVLAAQRAPNVQFVRTCSRAAACQYGIVVLRAATSSCALCVAAYAVTYVCCGALDDVLHITAANESSSSLHSGGYASAHAAHTEAAAPLFETATPPTPSVGSCYGLYDFGVSASGVWSRLLPRLGPWQTLYQQVCEGRLRPLHKEWRASLSAGDAGAAPLSSASPHALADQVWSALTPRGYCVVALLSRLPWRVLRVLQWSSEKASGAAVRRWHDMMAAREAERGAVPAEGAVEHKEEPQQRHRRPSRAQHRKRLLRSPLFRVATLLAGDVAFASLVYLATSYVSPGSSGNGVRPLFTNAAGARYNVFCWVEVACSVVNLVDFL